MVDEWMNKQIRAIQLFEKNAFKTTTKSSSSSLLSRVSSCGALLRALTNDTMAIIFSWINWIDVSEELKNRELILTLFR